MWLVPPTMKSQITLLTRGAKCGLPSGGAQPPVVVSAAHERIAREHRSECQACEPHADVGQERATVQAATAGCCVALHGFNRSFSES